MTMPNGPLAPSATVQPDGSLSPYNPTAAIDYWCSIPADTVEGKMLRYAARQGKAEQAADAVNREIVVTDLLLHGVTMTSDSGEVKDLTRSVMVLDDGTMVGSCSTGIVGCLKTACAEFGLPPWRPGLRFKVIRIPLKQNQQTYKLEPVIVTLPKHGAAKK